MKSIYENTPESIINDKDGIRKSIKNWFGIDVNDDRLLKYYEILLKGENASPYSDIETMSFRRLGIALTAKCNAHCFACYRFDPQYKSMLNHEIPWATLYNFVKNTEGKFKMVHVAGLGEVWLYPKLFQAIELCTNLSKNIKITTNSSFINKDNLRKIEESGLTHIEVSIWQFDQKKEKKYRGLDFEKSIDDLIYISENTKLDLQVNTMVASYNYEDLFSIVEKLKNINKLTFHTVPLFETKTAKKQGIQRISDDEYKKLLFSIKKDIKNYNLNWILKPDLNEISVEPVIEMKRNKNICFTAFEDPYISETGHLLPCVRLKALYSSGIPLPRIDASIGFEKVWHHKAMVEFRHNMLTGHYPQLCGQLCYLKKQNIQPDKKYLNNRWKEAVKIRSEQSDMIVENEELG